MIHKCKVVCEDIDESLGINSMISYSDFSLKLSRVDSWRTNDEDDNGETVVYLANSMYFFIDTPFEQFDKLMHQYESGVARFNINPQ